MLISWNKVETISSTWFVYKYNYATQLNPLIFRKIQLTVDWKVPSSLTYSVRHMYVTHREKQIATIRTIIGPTTETSQTIDISLVLYTGISRSKRVRPHTSFVNSNQRLSFWRSEITNCLTTYLRQHFVASITFTCYTKDERTKNY